MSIILFYFFSIYLLVVVFCCCCCCSYENKYSLDWNHLNFKEEQNKKINNKLMQIIIYERVFIINRYLSLYVVSGLDLKNEIKCYFCFFFFY